MFNTEKTDHSIRKAVHFNSWYLGPSDMLKKELEEYLSKVEESKESTNIRGMIVPHAGIMWSGPTAAWGFKNLINSSFKRIIIIGPSHFYKFKGCGLTIAKQWETPFCNLNVDRKGLDELKKNHSDLFCDLPLQLDEYEHSLELQLPYLGYIYKDKVDEIEILPIMTGKMSFEEEEKLASILLPYYENKENVFVISEDFCHWGPRHDFWYHDEKHGEIHQSIEFLDNLAFEAIKSQSGEVFKKYLEEWKNNLCGGGAPVTVYVALMELAKKEKKIDNTIDFIYYTKSNPKITSKDDESVSYAVGLNVTI